MIARVAPDRRSLKCVISQGHQKLNRKWTFNPTKNTQSRSVIHAVGTRYIATCTRTRSWSRWWCKVVANAPCWVLSTKLANAMRRYFGCETIWIVLFPCAKSHFYGGSFHSNELIWEQQTHQISITFSKGVAQRHKQSPKFPAPCLFESTARGSVSNWYPPRFVRFVFISDPVVWLVLERLQAVSRHGRYLQRTTKITYTEKLLTWYHSEHRAYVCFCKLFSYKVETCPPLRALAGVCAARKVDTCYT